MKLKEVMEILDARPVWNSSHADLEVVSCHASDLISDVLAFSDSGSLFLTGLTNSQVIRTAQILDFTAICFVRGKTPQPEAITLAEEQELPLLITHLSMYESCGRLYKKGLAAIAEQR